MQTRSSAETVAICLHDINYHQFFFGRIGSTLGWGSMNAAEDNKKPTDDPSPYKYKYQFQIHLIAYKRNGNHVQSNHTGILVRMEEHFQGTWCAHLSMWSSVSRYLLGGVQSSFLQQVDIRMVSSAYSMPKRLQQFISTWVPIPIDYFSHRSTYQK